MGSLIELERERFEWATKTFPCATSMSSLNKLREEIVEIEAGLTSGTPDPFEYADALMCLLDSASRAGVTPEVILEAFEKKISINKLRTWRRNTDNTYSHIK